MPTARPLPPVAALLAALAVGIAASAGAGELQVVATDPPGNAGDVAAGTAISVTFDRPLAPASITAASFRAFGRSSGTVTGAFTFSAGGQTVTLTPTRPFAPGETVWVNLANTIAAADASPLRSAGWAFQFTVAAAPAQRSFEEIDVLDVRTSPGSSTRAYGGFATDLDLDGWIDLGIVNEDSADLRVFMNRADGTGLYDPFLTPPTPIGDVASPNEAADFDNDGFTDAVTANVADGTVSIVLGNGDGSFAPQQVVAVGSSPRGVAVLDADGDGDLDIVVAASQSDNLALTLNDGDGVFGAATTFESGGSGEYGLASGDMDGDGILDLVVGTRFDNEIQVLLGNGDGTFTNVESEPSGGTGWMLALGDLDGDGDLDVTAAGGQAANGSVLLGKGDGILGPATTYAASGLTVATDLGDLDGDGDLDWVLASFGGGRWHVFTNDGAGAMTPDGEIVAPANASCSIMVDFDRDGDLDMALVDEIADVVALMQNSGLGIFADGFESGDTSAWSGAVGGGG